MKKWTFFDQMLASFLVIVISSILSALLHLPIAVSYTHLTLPTIA